MRVAVVVVAVALLCAGCSQEDEISDTPDAGGKSMYNCQPARPVAAESVWPIPTDAERTASGVYTKPLRLGKGRKPKVGTGQALVICATYYDRTGAVVQHDPVIVHDIDLPPKEWQEVLVLMSEEEIRRLWIPPRRHIKDFVIVDFELEPFPVSVPTLVRPKRGEEKKATTERAAPTSTTSASVTAMSHRVIVGFPSAGGRRRAGRPCAAEKHPPRGAGSSGNRVDG
jgi:hypothetical protein